MSLTTGTLHAACPFSVPVSRASIAAVPAILEWNTNTRMSSCGGSPRTKPTRSRRLCPSRRDAPQLNGVPGGRRGPIRVFEFDSWAAGVPAYPSGRCLPRRTPTPAEVQTQCVEVTRSFPDGPRVSCPLVTRA